MNGWLYLAAIALAASAWLAGDLADNMDRVAQRHAAQITECCK